MADRKEPSPQGALTFQQQQSGETAAGTPRLTPAEQSFWQNILDRTSSPPPLETRASYPITLLGMTEDLILGGRGPAHEEARRKLTPMLDSIRNIKAAYEILAYQRCNSSDRDFIDGNLTLDRTRREKDEVTLTDKEAMILGRLTQAADIPADPTKRTFPYSEIAQSSNKGPAVG